MHKFTHTETQCTRMEKTLHQRQDFGRLCVLKTKWRAHRPGDGASFHMTSSEHHGMGHQAVPKHQPRRFVHPSLNLVVGHKRRKKAVKKHLPPHQTPVGSHVQSNLGSLVQQRTWKIILTCIFKSLNHLLDTSHPNQTGSLAEIESLAMSISNSTGWLLYTTRRPPTFIIVLILDPYLNNWVLVVFKALQGIAMQCIGQPWQPTIFPRQSTLYVLLKGFVGLGSLTYPLQIKSRRCT